MISLGCFLRRTVAALTVCSLALPSLAHDDDPKILDRQAPVMSAGYRPAAFLAGGSQSAVLGLAATPSGTQNMLNSLADEHITFPSSGMQLLSWLPLGELHPGAITGNDCWGYTSPSGREYAMIGLSNGTAFVDISSPSDPVLLHHQAGEISLWRDVKTYQQYAYIVSEGGGGIQVMDLGQIDAGSVTLANTIPSPGSADSHNVAIDTDSGYLYRTGGGAGRGLQIYSLSNPAAPVLVGSWNSRYVHDVQVVTYNSGPYAGKQIAFCCSGFGNGSTNTGLTILDVTNKNGIFTRAQFYYSNAAYSHQAWLSPDRTRLYLNDELDEDGQLPTTTFVIDVTNLNSPQQIGTFTNNKSAIGHNLYTKGNLIFEANYRSGVRVFDAGTGANATEVAYFDTWPGDDSPNFNGLWSCYPYFPSGIVIGSDLERGLFVWWMGSRKLDFDVLGGAPLTVHPGGGTVDIQINELTAGDLQAGSERLYYDAGAGLVELPLASLGGGTFQAQFPVLPCGETLRWFVGARSNDGILWTFPETAPYDHLEAQISEGQTVLFEDDFEIDRGWTAGIPSDSATAGFWLRSDPIASSISTEDDHTPGGTLCYMTGLLGDVDGGVTTLTSPVMDLASAGSPRMSFWLYFRKDGLAQPSDRCEIQISNDTGATWTTMETIKDDEPTEFSTWTHHSYRVSDWVTPSATVQIRVRVRDVNLDSKIKALFDDFRVTQEQCGCQLSSYCVASLNSSGSAALITSSGSASVSLNNLTLQVAGGVPGGLGLFFYGSGRAQVPLAEGTLCVSGGVSGVQRLQPPLALDATGSGSRFLDLTAAPAASGAGAIQAGSTWDFQFWYRDPAGGPGGSNLSDGLEVTFCQ